jgi:hypothetical protein
MKYEVWSGDGLETRRTDKGVAYDDARILRWLGKSGVTVREIEA